MNIKQIGMYVALTAVAVVGTYQGLNDLEKIAVAKDKPVTMEAKIPEQMVKFQLEAPAYDKVDAAQKPYDLKPSAGR